MSEIDFPCLLATLRGQEVERPNRSGSGTLSGHAAGEPFEKKVCADLRAMCPGEIFKQHEYLNDLYRRHPAVLTVEGRRSLFDSPTVLFLLSRGEKATREWDVANPFAERQNDTADVIHLSGGRFTLIDVKSRNVAVSAQPPNIISAYKVASMCALMIDNGDYDSFDILYVEVDWREQAERGTLRCTGAHMASLFAIDPSELYINWSAAMQIQFHVADIGQTWTGGKERWARAYLRHFVASAEQHCQKMREKFVTPFEKYI